MFNTFYCNHLVPVYETEEKKIAKQVNMVTIKVKQKNTAVRYVDPFFRHHMFGRCSEIVKA